MDPPAPVRPAAFFLLASVVVSFLAAASAPTPLYPLYQEAWALTPLTITVIFAAYAVAVLVALLVLGRLSDHLGRRPVLFGAFLAQILAMALFAAADGPAAMILARVVQGLSAGTALAAAGAAVLDLDRHRGTIANSVGPAMGTATGGVVAGVIATLLPAPERLVYLVLGLVLVGQLVALLFVRETAVRRPGAVASLLPRLTVSPRMVAPLLGAAPAIVASWALVGFVAALSPSMVRDLLGGGQPLAGGLALFAMAASGVLAVLAFGAREPRLLMRAGSVVLAAGVLLVAGALTRHWTAAFFAGLAVSGVGFGVAFQGAVRGVVGLASPQERASVLSVVYVLAYLAMGLPAVGAGWLLASTGDLAATALEFAAAVALLAFIAVLPRRPIRALLAIAAR